MKYRNFNSYIDFNTKDDVIARNRTTKQSQVDNGEIALYNRLYFKKNPESLSLSAPYSLCGEKSRGRNLENKGFTLIEIIVALLIFGILSTILFSTLIQIQRRTSTSTWRNELTEEGVKICNTIRRELTGAREILYADEDSISFFNQEGELSSFYVKDSLLFKSKKRLVSAKTKISSFKFIYYLPNDIIGETASPIYSLPLDAINLQRVTVIDWKIGLKKEITSIHLKTGIFTRNIRQQ